ncbi:thiol reductant ABC exporter subunit CydC [Rothia aerolata]|nr:thiol reductant ABC exporter subunit CydC [Rothia aerolata]
MNQRPPLGPSAAANLTVFGVLSAVKAFSMLLFASVVGTALTYMARMTFLALHENQVFASEYQQRLAIFAGNTQAQVSGIWLSTLGREPSVMLLLGMGLLAALLRAASDWALNYFAARAATGAKSTIRARLIDRVLATGGVDTPDGTGATAVLLSRGLDALDNYYTKTLTAAVSSVVVPVILLVYIGFHDWVSALVILVTLPLIPLFMVLIGKTTQSDTARSQQELLRLSDHIVELVKGLPVLIGLGRARAQSRALAQLGERYRTTTMVTLRSAFMSSFWLELLTTISIAVVAVLIGVRLVHGQMGLDVALLALLLAPECFQPLRNVGSAFHQSQDGVQALRTAQQIIDQPLPETTVNPDGQDLIAQKISVSYPGRGEVLNQVDFRIKRGSTTAITGASGCGKSTLLGVMSGSITNGLVPTGSTEPMRVTGQVTGTGETVWVSQSPAFIASSVINEVALFGFPAEVEFEEDLDAVLALLDESGPMSLSRRGREKYLGYLRMVGLADFADLAPESLSAGQMRRLAIARTLARVDALEKVGRQVTVLVDEPTAHLDSRAAERVNASLAALAATGATLLIVTHDLSLTERTDYVLSATMQREGFAARWKLTTGGGRGWNLEELRQTVAEEAPAPGGQEAPKLPQRRPEKQPKRSVLKTLRDVSALTGITASQAVAPVLLSTLAASFAISLTALSGWLIVRAAEQPAMMYLLVAVVGVRFFGLGRASLRYLERLKTHDLVLRAANTLRVRAWDSAGRTVLSIRSLLRGDKILDRLVGDIDELRDALPRVVLPVATHLAVMVLALVVTGFALPQALPVVAVATLIVTLLVPALVLYTDSTADSAARESTAEMLRLGVSSVDAARDLQANGLNDLVSNAFAEKDRRNVDSTLDSSRAQGFGQGLTSLTWWLATLATIGISWSSVREGAVTAPSAAIVVLMCTALFETTGAHIEAVRGWPAFAQLVARMRPLLEVNSRIAVSDDEDERVLAQRAELGSPITLDLSGVSTRWPGMKAPVFEDLTARAESGAWLGITGPSGSGKTTALATLLGFLPAETGSISVNGRQLSQQQLRGYAAWCPQSAYIFESSIANNLALAAPGEKRPSDQEMLDVLDRVGLGQFVRSLPEGLQTQVGAGGSYVSGGQRQRIAIARTLLTDSPLLLMDEPTAHLDTESARALIAEVARGTKVSRETLGEVAKDSKLKVPPAVILVSHRPEDIEACDEVVKL